MTNYVDIINKYITWYKDCYIEVRNEPIYNLPIFVLVDERLKTEYPIYFVDSIISTFRLLGVTRLCYQNRA